MTLAEIQEALKDRNLSYVARKIGMHRQQLWRIATGKDINPTIRTLQRIEEYLKKGE